LCRDARLLPTAGSAETGADPQHRAGGNGRSAAKTLRHLREASLPVKKKRHRTANDTSFEKGGKPGPGHKPGVPNNNTTTKLKQAILDATLAQILDE